MFARRKIAYRLHFFLPHLLLFGLITGCAPTLVGPVEPNSSLIIGRVVVNNKYSGAFYGGLPLGVLDKGLEVEIESRDGSQSFKVTTEEEGYFFVPNVTPNTYHILAVTIEGGTSSGGKEKIRQPLRRPIFTPVPGKMTYIGTLVIDLSEKGLSAIREVREDDRARAYFFQKHAASQWAAREFIAAGPRPAPSVQVAQEKERPVIEAKPISRAGVNAEKPEWKVRYQWRYAWKQPGGSGTITFEVVREDTFEGVPSYVLRAGKEEYFYTKDVLGVLAGMSGGRLSVKRDAPHQFFSWPLAVGKEWRSTYLRENVREKSSRTYDYRMAVAKIEEVKVPAGTFEGFKIETYEAYSGNLSEERWYSPQVKYFVKIRIYGQEGTREWELISYKTE